MSSTLLLAATIVAALFRPADAAPPGDRLPDKAPPAAAHPTSTRGPHGPWNVGFRLPHVPRPRLPPPRR